VLVVASAAQHRAGGRRPKHGLKVVCWPSRARALPDVMQHLANLCFEALLFLGCRLHQCFVRDPNLSLICCVLPCRYDKPGTMSKGRKIGHINVVAPTRAEARQRLAAIEAAGEQSLR
jgi:hypothetical protein